MTQLFIALGGPSNEREVSLRGGEYLCEILSLKGISYEKIEIDNNLFCLFGEKKLSVFEMLSHVKSCNGAIFPLMHGAYGEDGIFASLCESFGVHLLVSSARSLALMMDKDETKSVLARGGITTPTGIRATKTELLGEEELRSCLEFPLIIKPNSEGSSQGLALISSIDELDQHVTSLPEDSDYLCEERIVGREFSVGVVLYNGELYPLPATEIILTNTELFDEVAKYSTHGCLEVTPAEVSSEVMGLLQRSALLSHQLCQARYISRTDMILTAEGEVVVLEINAIPGMTRTSFLPAQLSAVGLDMGDLLTHWLSQERE